MPQYDQQGNVIANSDPMSNGQSVPSQDAMQYALTQNQAPKASVTMMPLQNPPSAQAPNPPPNPPTPQGQPVARNRAGQPVKVDPLGTFSGAMQGLGSMLADAGKGTLATMGGIAGDIEGLGRAGINYLAPKVGSDVQVNPEPSLPTTEDIYNKMPDLYKGQGSFKSSVPAQLGAGVVGAIVDPFTAVRAIKATKGLPVGMSIEDVGKGALESVKPPKPPVAEPIKAPHKQGLYSPLEEAVLNLKQDKGGGEQMLNMLKGTKGVKPDELKFRNFDEFLKGKKKVTKEEMLKYLEENPIPVSETKLGDKYLEHELADVDPDYDTPVQEFFNNWRRAERDDEAWQEEHDYRRYDDTDYHEVLKEDFLRDHNITEEEFEASPELQKDFEKVLDEYAESSANEYDPYVIGHDTHNYTIHGDQYGEVRLHGPQGYIDDFRNINEAQNGAMEHALDQGDIEPIYENETVELNKPMYDSPSYNGVNNGLDANYEEHLYHYTPKERESFRSNHFNDDANHHQNLMSHQRLVDATLEDGTPALKVEEQQSDWHQAGRRLRVAKIEEIKKELMAQDSALSKEQALEKAKKLVPEDFGYKMPERKAQVEALSKIADDADDEFNRFLETPEYKEAFERAQTTGDDNQPALLEARRLQANKTQTTRNWRTANEILQEGKPDAPYKSTWNEFLMKKALYEAALRDKPKLVWTTGETQANRWNELLHENLDAIKYRYDPSNDEYIVHVRKPGEQEFNLIRRAIKDRDLEEYVGDHIAKQMRENQGVEHLVVSPYALKYVEGSEKHIKTQYGDYIEYGYEAPDGVVYRGTGANEFEARRNAYVQAKKQSVKYTPQVIEGENLSVTTKKGKGHKGFYDDIQSLFLKNYLKKYGVTPKLENVTDKFGRVEQVHSIDITPEMKKDFLERGQPAFKKGGAVKMADGGSVMATELAKMKEILAKKKIENELSGMDKRTSELRAYRPYESLTEVKPVTPEQVNAEYQARQAKPTVGLRPTDVGGSRIPSTQLELFKKKGGKVVSLDEMRYELMRKRNA